jgi:hypothetical protein
MDPYLYTVLASLFATTTAALDARPSTAVEPCLETARIEQLIDAHRSMAEPLRVVPVASPVRATPQLGCAPANR